MGLLEAALPGGLPSPVVWSWGSYGVLRHVGAAPFSVVGGGHDPL
jgi:hypothetical protein